MALQVPSLAVATVELTTSAGAGSTLGPLAGLGLVGLASACGVTGVAMCVRRQRHHLHTELLREVNKGRELELRLNLLKHEDKKLDVEQGRMKLEEESIRHHSQNKRKAMELEHVKHELDAEVKRRRLDCEADAQRSEQDLSRERLKTEAEQQTLKMQLESEARMAEEQRRQRELDMEQQTVEISRQEALSVRQEVENARIVQTLQKPRLDMLKYAKAACDRDVDTEVLATLEAVGFQSFTDPVCFQTEPNNMKVAVCSALQHLPAEMRTAIADHLVICPEAQGVQTLSTFDNGHGTYATVTFWQKQADGKRSVAVLPYGMSFDCAKTVDYVRSVETPVPIYEQVPQSVKNSSGWFSSSYRTEMRQKYVRTETRLEHHPVFKEKVLSMDKLQKVMNALEFCASKKAVENMS